MHVKYQVGMPTELPYFGDPNGKYSEYWKWRSEGYVSGQEDGEYVGVELTCNRTCLGHATHALLYKSSSFSAID